MQKYSTDTLQAALKGYDQEIKRLTELRNALAAQLGVRAGKEFRQMLGVKTQGKVVKIRTMSLAARKRIAAAQKKRWAAFHAMQNQNKEYQKD